MDVLKGVLKDSEKYYKDLEKEIKKRLLNLPEGSIKKRNLKGHAYYYLQKREGNKVVHNYLGKLQPEEIKVKLRERKELKAELKKVNEALRLLKKSNKSA